MFLKQLWKRLRGALGVATFWGAVWVVGGVTVMLAMGLHDTLGLERFLRTAGRLGATGFFAGGAFSGYLTFAHRRRTALQINTINVSLMGGLVAAVLSPGMAGLAGLLGTVCAASSVVLAKRGARDDEALPSSSDLVGIESGARP